MTSAATREFTGVHNMIRGLIHLVDTGLGSVRTGNDAQVRTLADLGQFGVVGTRFHHQVEDRHYWPAIVTNGADPAELEQLAEEHHELDPLLDRMEEVVAELAAHPGDAGALESLRSVFADYRTHMLGHLDHEEPIFFPLLDQHMPDAEAERLAAQVAKSAPRKGISWLMGGVQYAMTDSEAAAFLHSFPKPVLWFRPLMLRTYRKNCAVLGVDPATPSQR
jgi:hemerythrin-like domain-containing protein